MACVKFHLTSINFSFTKSVRKDPTSEGTANQKELSIRRNCQSEGTVNQKESYELGSEERLNTNLKIILIGINSKNEHGRIWM